ncbi:MAG: helix-turn-helix domain-containing protein [Spirochaetota bacterium]
MKLKPITSLSRTFTILEYLTSRRGARFKDIVAAVTGISHASLSRLLDDLESLGYVAKRDGLYFLKRGIGRGIVLQPQGTQDIVRSLARELSMSAGIFAPLGRTTMVIIDRENVADQGTIAYPGREMPMYAVHGFAKIFLAYADDEVRSEMHQGLAGIVHNRKPDYATFIRALDETKRTGVAVEEMEWQSHIARFTICVLGGEHTPRYALGVIGAPETVKRKKEIIDALKKGRDAFETLLVPHAEG